MSVQQNRQNYGNAEPVKPFGRKKQIEGERMLPLFFFGFFSIAYFKFAYYEFCWAK